MIVSDREKAMAVITVVVLLFGLLISQFGKKKAEVETLRGQQREKERLYTEYCNLINQRGVWEEAYSRNSDKMPVFERGRQVQTYWLGVLDRIASTNGLSIIRRQAGEERQEGDVYELPIECKEWEGSLESLTKFLYDIHAEGAMLDVRKLFIRPGSAANGKQAAGLRGSFTLTCAYLRADAVEKPAETVPGPGAPEVQGAETAEQTAPAEESPSAGPETPPAPPEAPPENK